jgi:hypothetical protein
MTKRLKPRVDNNLVTIKKSQIEGLGVFAKEDIPKGTKIADYYGKEMKWKTFKKKYGEYKSNSLHTYPMRRIWKIIVAKEEPYKTENLTNYINENKREKDILFEVPKMDQNSTWEKISKPIWIFFIEFVNMFKYSN